MSHDVREEWTLRVHVAKGTAVANDVVLITADRIAKGSSFSRVRVAGLPAGYEPVVVRHGNELHLVNANATKHGHGHSRGHGAA